jgi:hypothetical protein
MSVTFGCCVGSWEKFAANVGPHTWDFPVVALAGQSSIARAYNQILNIIHDSPWRHCPLVLQHDDLEITDPLAVDKILEAADNPDVALIGVAGGSADKGLPWWESDPIGHQLTDSGLLDFGDRSGTVDLIEGSLMVFTPWAVTNLRFDETYLGYHGYDEVAMQAKTAEKYAVVIDLDTHHHTTLGFRSAESEAVWHEANTRFHQKWMSS